MKLMKTPLKLTVIFRLIILYSNICFSQNSSQFQDKFVIILDVQREYTENSMSESSAQKLIDSVNYVIENTDSNNIIYVKSFHRLLNLSFSLPLIYVSIDTSAKWDFDNRMKLVSDNIISKEESNVFEVKELTDFLHKNNAKEIIVIGLMAEQCVYESLIGGKELGYSMYVIPEAITGKSQESKAKVLRKLQERGIGVMHLW